MTGKNFPRTGNSGNGSAIPHFLPVSGYNHNEAVVAAKFPLQEAGAGREEYGVVYRDDTCSCHEFTRRGICRHIESWIGLVQAVRKRYLRGQTFDQLVDWLAEEHDFADQGIVRTIVDEGISSLYDDALGHINQYR